MGTSERGTGLYIASAAGQGTTGCQPGCSWGAETFGEGGGHGVPGEKRTLEYVCGCGGD